MNNNYEETLKGFYPTPSTLIAKALDGIDWKELAKTGASVLEPSAGKGDFAKGVADAFEAHLYKGPQIDCIEQNPDLRATLKGKGYPVIADDFLSFHTYKRYGLIVMNPPFANGDEHLLKALEIQKTGGAIICILNAETIKNPFSNKRKELVQKLNEYQASIEYVESAFSEAERQTDVEIALVKVCIPEKESAGFILDSMKKGVKYEETEYDATAIAVPDYVKASVLQYNMEVEAGIRLIEEYRALAPYLRDSLTEERWSSPILELKISGGELSVNRYVELTRQKYWNALFRNPKFTGKMTSDQQAEYLAQVDTLKDYDFSVFNIREMQIQMSRSMVQGIEDCIMKLFDKMSAVHSWYPECEKNIHYYNGWATNKAYIVGKKVVLPAYSVFNQLFKKFQYNSWNRNLSEVYDAEKVFAYLGAQKQVEGSLSDILKKAEEEQETKNIRTPYFDLTFYKKGTVHITFTDEEALKRFNIFGSRMRGWLPQNYGKKHYRDMAPEEKEIIDAFEGEVSYEQVVSAPEKYLYEPENAVLRLSEAS